MKGLKIMGKKYKNKKYGKSGDERCDENSRNSGSDRFAEDRRSSKKSNSKEHSRRRGKDSPRNNIVGGNDPNWYVTDTGTLNAVANLPFGVPAGYPVKWLSGKWANYNPEDADYDAAKDVEYTAPTPGVLAMHYTPTYGVANSHTDPLSMAAQSIYTFIRSTNSGAKNYDPADLLVYLMSVDNLYMAYLLLGRLYGTLYMSNVMNRYMPRTVFEAQGFDYDDFMGRTADFKAYLDQIAVRISQMAMPAHMPLFERHQYLCSNIFTDASTFKSQFIIPVPTKLWQYEGYSDKKGGRMVTVEWPDGLSSSGGPHKATFNDVRSIVDTMIDRVVNDIDCGTISGDILKAFSTSGLHQLAYYPNPYVTVPVYDPTFCLQLHNAVAVGSIKASCHQSNPANANESRYLTVNYRTNTEFYNNVNIARDQFQLNFNSNEVTPAMVIEATRLIPQMELEYEDADSDAQVQGIVAKSCGSEIVEWFDLHVMNKSPWRFTTHPILINEEGETNTDFLLGAALLTAVTDAPTVYLMDVSGGDASVVMRIGTIDNYGVFPVDKLFAMNNMAITKMLGVPAVSYGIVKT